LLKKGKMKMISYTNEMQEMKRNQILSSSSVGVINFDTQYKITWMNTYMYTIFPDSIQIGKNIIELLDIIIPKQNNPVVNQIIKIGDKEYAVSICQKGGYLYLIDIPKQEESKCEFYRHDTVIALIYLDNY